MNPKPFRKKSLAIHKLLICLFNSIKLWLSKTGRFHLIAVFIIFIIAIIVTFSNLGSIKEFIGDDAGVGAHYSDEQLNKTFGMWDSYTFPGKSNITSTVEILHVTFINILHKIGLTSIIVDRLFYFLIYFISGLGIYLLSFEICSKLFHANNKKITIAALTAAVFYMLNNFTMILLSFPPTSYIYSYVLLPWIFLLYLKDYHISDDLLKKLSFAFLFLLILSGNPSNTVSIIVLIIFYEVFFRNSNKIFHHKKNFVTTLLLILLMSSYIILPALGNKGNPYDITTEDIKPSILYNSTLTSIGNLLRFQGHPAQASYIFNQFLTEKIIINLNYILLAIASLFLLRKKIRRNEIFLLLTFVIFLFLAKSVHPPFPELNSWLFEKIPFFGMYRATYYKFIYFCVFAFSLLLAISILNIDERVSRIKFLKATRWLFLFCPLIIVLYCAKPFFDGIVVAKIHKSTIPVEYHQINTFFENDRQDFSILALPQMPLGLTLDWGNKNYYAGGANPDYYLLGRPVWSSGWFLPKRPTSNDLSFYKNLIGLTSTKYIFLHKDIPEKYLFEVDVYGDLKGQTNYKSFDSELAADSNFTLVEENNHFKVYKLTGDSFQPHLYIPQETTISKDNIEDFLNSKPTKATQGAIYFERQNIGKEGLLDNLKKLDLQNIPPSLEYKKISANKYRILVHGASKEFPLVFSESYNDGWNLYLNRMNKPEANLDRGLSKYKILDQDSDSQATKDDLINFVHEGYISTLGNGSAKEYRHLKWAGARKEFNYSEKYNINFVSKNFQGTIQNDNLDNGAVTETLFKAPMDQNNHLMVNGYANSWIIDSNTVCSNNQECIKNPDGTYDMELVLEFSPQRFFYLGLLLSGTTTFLCIILIVYYRKRTLNNKTNLQSKIEP